MLLAPVTSICTKQIFGYTVNFELTITRVNLLCSFNYIISFQKERDPSLETFEITFTQKYFVPKRSDMALLFRIGIWKVISFHYVDRHTTSLYHP